MKTSILKWDSSQEKNFAICKEVKRKKNPMLE